MAEIVRWFAGAPGAPEDLGQTRVRTTRPAQNISNGEIVVLAL
ncbi:MAG: hypothetical protein NTW87_13460 [Planctomycetota bacterium]|nr:hypothetical protein [Planctomycetota bacterium]